MKKRTVALLLACVLVIGVAAGGTMAWLMDQTNAIENTFTAGEIDIELSETGAQGGKNTYDFVPGDEIEKDPKVTVKAPSEACWLFVKVAERGNIEVTGTGAAAGEKVLQYEIADGWTAGTGTNGNGIPAGYWFREVGEVTGQDEDFAVLKDDTVTVSQHTTMTEVAAMKANAPTITVVAAAVQRAHIDSVTAAWAELPSAFKS